MAHRRELLSLLVVAFLLLVPGRAVATPTWLPSESLDAIQPLNQAPDVATDSDGNSVAVWLDGDAVRAAYRPRGGAWAVDAENLEPAHPVVTFVSPHVVARPGGEFVAVWSADRNNDGDDVLRSAIRSASGAWSAGDVRDPCCAGILAVEAGADGTVTVISPDIEGLSSNTLPSDGDAWDEADPLPFDGLEALAAGPNGDVVAVRAGSCGEFDCIRAAYRPPGGPWEPDEPAGPALADEPTGLAAAANPDGSFTAIWGESTGEVRSADRAPGAGGGWNPAPQIVASTSPDAPGCIRIQNCFDLAADAAGDQVATWWQSGEGGERIAASVRPAGGVWGGEPEDVGGAGGETRPFAAFTTTKVPAVVWGSEGANEAVASASYRDAAGEWQPTQLSDPIETAVYIGDVVADGDGNAVTAWIDQAGVAAAGFDAGGPRFSAFSFPSGSAGQALSFSVAAEDNWSGPPAIGWLFGDGGVATGPAVSHSYAAAGDYAASVAATDQVGNQSVQPGTVSVVQPPPPPPPPPGCGTADTDRDGIGNLCDDNNGAERPRPFRTVNATVVSGDVFVKLPAGSASTSQARPPRGFVRLEGAETIPVGSTLDTARGRVKIRSAATTGRRLQTGQFFRGRFLIRQRRIKRRSSRLITDMRLTGSSFRRTCRTTRAAVSQRRSKRRVRRLFGNAKGRFRTSGRNAAATVRGTRWGVQDRCDGTLVAVQQGRVEVRDLVKRKTIILRAGRTYVAKRR